MAVDNLTPALAASWFAVALADDIDETPTAVEVLGRHWAVFRIGSAGSAGSDRSAGSDGNDGTGRGADGEVVAFVDRCPHRLAPLSIGTVTDDGHLRCGYHGWEFDAAGACTRIPALGDDATIPPRACLTPAAGVQERYGLVWLAPEPPVADLPAFDEWDDPSFDTCWNTPRPTSAGAAQLCDNFLDAAHLPVVHLGTFGVADADYLPPEPVERNGWTASTTYRVTYANHDDPAVATGEHPLEQPQDLYKEVRPATTAFIRLGLPLTGACIAILFSCLPHNEGRTTVFKMMARNDFGGDEARLAESIIFEDKVLDEDLAVLEAYRSQELPTDTTVEVHTRVDRLSATYRRMLADLLRCGEAVLEAGSEAEAEHREVTQSGRPQAEHREVTS